MNLAGFEKIAPYLSSPLVLAGFVLMLAYGIHWQLMKSGLLRPVTRKDSGLIIRLFLRYGFWLALVLLLAGFGLQFSSIGLSAWNSYMDKEKIVAVNAGKVAEKLYAQLDTKDRQLESKDEQLKALTEAVTALSKADAPAKDINAALRALEQGDTKEAEAIFAEVLRTKEAVGVAANKEAAAAARHLGALAYLNSPLEALVHYQKAVQLDPDNPTGWNMLAILLHRTGELVQAEEAYRKLLTLGEAHQDKKEQAWAYGNLGLVYEGRGELSRAEEMHRKALALNKAVGSEQDMSSNYGNLGNVHWRRGELDNAEQMYKKAFTLAEALGYKEGMAADYSGLANVFYTRGELDKAEEMYRKALELDEALGRRGGMARNYGNLGVVYKIRGELDKAEKMYRKSLEISETFGLKEITAGQYFNLGLLYVKRGNPAQAEELCRKSLSLYQKMEAMQNPDAKKVQQALDELAQERSSP